MLRNEAKDTGKFENRKLLGLASDTNPPLPFPTFEKIIYFSSSIIHVESCELKAWHESFSPHSDPGLRGQACDQ